MLRLGKRLPQDLMREERGPAGRQRDHRMIHLLQHQAVQVDEIARHMHGRKLPPSAAQIMAARGEAAQHQTAVLWHAVLLDEFFAGCEIAGPTHDQVERD